MKNEKGITLIELLVAVVIAGIVIVPLLTIMTGTFTRTISQEKETRIAYVVQEVMEKVRQNKTPALKTSGCWTNISTLIGCDSITLLDINSTQDIYVKAFVNPYHDNPIFNEVEIKVTASTPTKVVNGPSDGVKNKNNTISFFAVVKNYE
jgi:prepilin-type N-terminal cleavage/methylation domain-containing protein